MTALCTLAAFILIALGIYHAGCRLASEYAAFLKTLEREADGGLHGEN